MAESSGILSAKGIYRPHNPDAVENLSWSIWFLKLGEVWEPLAKRPQELLKRAPQIKYSPDVRHFELQKVLIAYFCGERDILHPRKSLELYNFFRHISILQCGPNAVSMDAIAGFFDADKKPCWDLIYVEDTVRLRCKSCWYGQCKTKASLFCIYYTGSTQIPCQLSQSCRLPFFGILTVIPSVHSLGKLEFSQAPLMRVCSNAADCLEFSL